MTSTSIVLCNILLCPQDRRDELEGLDLAIERQKRNLWEMKQEEKDLKQDRKDARGELEGLRRKNEKRLFKL